MDVRPNVTGISNPLIDAHSQEVTSQTIEVADLMNSWDFVDV